MTAPRIAPSILSADFGRLHAEVAAVAEAGADWIHLDVMDGHFVPNITFGPQVVKWIRSATTLPFDAHLMISDPDQYAPQFVAAGADSVTIHAEATHHLHRSVQVVRATGAKVGVSLNPHTPLDVLDYVLADLDLVLIMTVNPGFGGQAFIPAMLRKIERLRQMIDGRGLAVDIQVDGGINSGTAEAAARAGADVFVAGSAVFKSGSYSESIAELRQLTQRGFASRGMADRK